jgi:hypothetical protein
MVGKGEIPYKTRGRENVMNLWARVKAYLINLQKQISLFIA